MKRSGKQAQQVKAAGLALRKAHNDAVAAVTMELRQEAGVDRVLAAEPKKLTTEGIIRATAIFGDEQHYATVVTRQEGSTIKVETRWFISISLGKDRERLQ